MGLDCKHFLLIGFDKKSPISRLNYNNYLKRLFWEFVKPKNNVKTRLIEYICGLKRLRQTNWWRSSAGKVTIFLVFGSVLIWSYLFMCISFFTLCFMLTEKELLCTHTCTHTSITWAFLFSFPFLSLWFSCFPFSIQNIINIMWKGAAFFSRAKSMSLWRIKKKQFLKSFHWNSNTLHKQLTLISIYCSSRK